MTGTLAFVGGAEFGPDCTFDADLFARGSSVAVLPMAQAYERPGDAVAAASEHLGAIGVEVVPLPATTRADACDPAVIGLLASAAGVYVPGGSPMHLRSALLGTPLLEAVVARWREGATVAVAAESAAVVCSHMVDLRGGAFTVGLGLVTTMTIVPRWNRWSHDKLHRTISLAPADLAVVGIDEATALVRAGDGRWTRAGAGGVHVYRAGAEVGFDALPSALNPEAGL